MKQVCLANVLVRYSVLLCPEEGAKLPDRNVGKTNLLHTREVR